MNFRDAPTIVPDNIQPTINIDSPRKIQSLISEEDYALEEDGSIGDSILESIDDKDGFTIRKLRA